MVDNPSSRPLTMLVRNLNADAHRVNERLITTAYHVIKTGQTFASFPRAIELQQKNGVDLGRLLCIILMKCYEMISFLYFLNPGCVNG